MDELLHKVFDPPPSNTNIHCPKFDQNILRDIIRNVNKIKPKLGICDKDTETLQFELKLLTQILYKNHNRFHNDKGYKDLRMLEKSVKKLVEFNFLRTVGNFLGLIPLSASVSLAVYLPPRPLAEHSLLQLYGAGALLARVEQCVLNSGQLLLQRLNLGHFWNVAAHELAVVARLWAVARHLLNNVKDVYEILAAASANLPNAESGSTLSFPRDLSKFLPTDVGSGERKSITFSDIEDFSIGEPVQRQMCIGEPVQRQICIGEPVQRQMCIGEPVQRSKINADPSALAAAIDTGVSIKRKEIDCLFRKEKAGKLDESFTKSVKCDRDTKESLTSMNKKMKRMLKARQNVNSLTKEPEKLKIIAEDNGGGNNKIEEFLTGIRDVDSLKNFIENENSLRKLNRKTALTRKLNQDNWRELKKGILSNINISKPKKSLKIGKRLIKEKMNSVSST